MPLPRAHPKILAERLEARVTLGLRSRIGLTGSTQLLSGERQARISILKWDLLNSWIQMKLSPTPHSKCGPELAEFASCNLKALFNTRRLQRDRCQLRNGKVLFAPSLTTEATPMTISLMCSHKESQRRFTSTRTCLFLTDYIILRGINSPMDRARIGASLTTSLKGLAGIMVAP